MKTLLTTLWAVLLIAIFSTLFTLWVKALIELAEWLIWRLKLQIKRTKEARRVRRSKNNLKPRFQYEKMEAKQKKYKVMVDGQVSNIEVDLCNFTIIEHRKVGRIIHHFLPSTKLSEFHEMLNEILNENENN